MHPISNLRRILLAAAAACLVGSLFTATTLAANPVIVVNATVDLVDAKPGDGLCDASAGMGVCTLRAAIMEANARPGPDKIQLDTRTYTLTIPPVPGTEPNSAAGDLNVFDDLTIVGGGWSLTNIEAADGGWQNAKSRVIETDGNTVMSLHLKSLTIRNGNSGIAGGGGIALSSGKNALFLDHVEMKGNHASGNSGGAIAAGDSAISIVNSWFKANVGLQAGAIETGGPTTIVDSKFDGNEALNDGAAIRFGSPAASSIVGSEFVGNISGQATIQIGRGGPAETTKVTITNTTFGDNKGSATLSATQFATGLLQNDTIFGNSGIGVAGPISLRDTIVAGSSATDCTGGVVSLGHNLYDDKTCPMQAGDLQGNPDLDQWSLDFTLARAPKVGSPAIDAGASCPSVDQHGTTRPLDGDGDNVKRCDIGAIEAPAVKAKPTPTPTPAPPTKVPPSTPPTPSGAPHVDRGGPGTPGITPPPTSTLALAGASTGNAEQGLVALILIGLGLAGGAISFRRHRGRPMGA